MPLKSAEVAMVLEVFVDVPANYEGVRRGAFVRKRGVCSTSLVARPPSNNPSISTGSVRSFDLREDSFVKGHFDVGLLRWCRPHFDADGVRVSANALMLGTWRGGRLRSKQKHDIAWGVASPHSCATSRRIIQHSLVDGR